jgi:hypothetical protein
LEQDTPAPIGLQLFAAASKAQSTPLLDIENSGFILNRGDEKRRR